MKTPSHHIVPDKKRALRERGYVYLGQFLTVESVEVLRLASNKMSCQALSILRAAEKAGESLSERARTRTGELIVVAEVADPAQVCRYEFMMGCCPEFEHLVTTQVQPAVEDLVGERLSRFKDKTNEKLPGGGAFRPHQDFAAYQYFAPRYHVTALLSIDKATLHNGCVQFATNMADVVAANPQSVAEVIGDHVLLHYHDGGEYHGDLRGEILNQLDWEPVECTPVDLVVFDSFVPHFSNVNASAGARRSIFVTFNLAADGSFYDQYYAEKRLKYDDPKFHVSTPTARSRSQ